MRVPTRLYKRLEALERAAAERCAERLRREEEAATRQLWSVLMKLTPEQADSLRRGVVLTDLDAQLANLIYYMEAIGWDKFGEIPQWWRSH